MEIELDIPTDWIACAHAAASPRDLANLRGKNRAEHGSQNSQIQIVAIAASLPWRSWGRESTWVNRAIANPRTQYEREYNQRGPSMQCKNLANSLDSTR